MRPSEAQDWCGRFNYEEASDELVLSGTWKEGGRRPETMEMRVALGCLCDCEACSQVEDTAAGTCVYRHQEYEWTWTRQREAAVESGCPPACFATALRYTFVRVAPASRSAFSKSCGLQQSIEGLPDAAAEALVQINAGASSEAMVQTCLSFQWWEALRVLLRAGAPLPCPSTGTFLSSLYRAALKASATSSLSMLEGLLALQSVVEQAAARTCNGRTCLEDALRKQAQLRRKQMDSEDSEEDEAVGEKLLRLIDLLVDAHMSLVAGSTQCWTLEELLALCSVAELGQCSWPGTSPASWRAWARKRSSWRRQRRGTRPHARSGCCSARRSGSWPRQSWKGVWRGIEVQPRSERVTLSGEAWL